MKMPSTYGWRSSSRSPSSRPGVTRFDAARGADGCAIAAAASSSCA